MYDVSLCVVWCVTCGVVCYLWCGVLPVVWCVTCGVLPEVCYLWCVTCGVLPVVCYLWCVVVCQWCTQWTEQLLHKGIGEVRGHVSVSVSGQ